MSLDVLSDVLRTVRLRSAVFYFVSCDGKWAAEAPASKDLAAEVMPGAEQVIEYHFVTQGECWAGILGEQPLKLRRGDIILLPQGDAHIVSSAPGMRADAGVDWQDEAKQHQRPFRLHYDDSCVPQVFSCDDGAFPSSGVSSSTSLVCGFIGCDRRPFNPLIAALPRLLHLAAKDGNVSGEQYVQLAIAEAGNRGPGSDAMLERLSEMMFVDAVRRHLDSMPERSNGWLAGLRDRFVGRALTMLHENPSAPWSIDELGRVVGLSRSALHDRFISFVGQPPMQYLTHWRMQLASRMLRDSELSIISIAQEVGYESESAFSRAFKRLTGLPPAAWRKALDTPATI
jgi:AraC-like DNA-binding protein